MVYRLVFEGCSFEFLSGGKHNFALEPRIGPHYIGFREDANVVFRYRSLSPPHYLIKGDYVALYALLYGSRIKIGTSNVLSVVERMYSQAPRLGMVIGIYSLIETLPTELIERKVIDAVGKRFKNLSIGIKKPNIDFILKNRNSGVNSNVVVALQELAKKVANENLEGVPGSLYEPGRYWFSSRNVENSIDFSKAKRCHTNVLKERCYKVRCKGVLRVYEDAICVIVFDDVSVRRKFVYVNTCDWFIWNLVFYDVEP